MVEDRPSELLGRTSTLISDDEIRYLRTDTLLLLKSGGKQQGRGPAGCLLGRTSTTKEILYDICC